MDDLKDFAHTFGLSQTVVKVLACVVILSVLAPGLLLLARIARWFSSRVAAWARAQATGEDERHRLRQRGRFAEHLQGRLLLLDDKEQWTDDRYAELEAEIELRMPTRSGLRQLLRSQGGLRREPSLSRALETSAQQLILLQGDPGSGKSVALRHLARRMLRDAATDTRRARTIPLYLNLKALRPEPGEIIDARLIDRFVRRALAEFSNADVDRFLDSELPRGERDGTWLFLFDSFDEIPDVLNAKDADVVVLTYSTALYEFLSGLRACRGIVSSRQFRAPQGVPWPIWNVLPLSPERQRQLIHQTSLSPSLKSMTSGSLTTADAGIVAMSTNPMFLGLLCEYVGEHGEIPSTSHVVFEAYVTRRLARDRDRVLIKFGLDETDVRTAAESFAYALTAGERLGLAPPRSTLAMAVKAAGQTLPGGVDPVVAMSALEYIKLARAENDAPDPNERTFSFSHRRFQEYFATCKVLADPGLVDGPTLIADGRWRETAVVLCQLQPTDAAPVVAAAGAALQELRRSLAAKPVPFSQNPRALHVLALLQQGFAGKETDLPSEIRDDAGAILSLALDGNVLDRKMAISAAGCARDEFFTDLLTDAFSRDSDWVKDAAYHQLSRVRAVSTKLSREIRLALVRQVGRTDMHVGPEETRTLLMRLPDSRAYLQTFGVLHRARTLDACGLTAVVGLAAFSTSEDGVSVAAAGVCALIAAATLVGVALGVRVVLNAGSEFASTGASVGEDAKPTLLLPTRDATGLLIITLCFRVVLAFSLCATLPHRWTSLPIAVAVLYCVTWAPVVFLTVPTRRWPRSTLAFVVPHWAAGRAAVPVARALFMTKSGRKRLGGVATLAIISLAVPRLVDEIPRWVGVAVVVLWMGGFALFVARDMVRAITGVVANWRWRQSWNPHASILTARTLIDWMNKQHNERAMVSMLVTVRLSKPVFDNTVELFLRSVLDAPAAAISGAVARAAALEDRAPADAEAAPGEEAPPEADRFFRLVFTASVFDELGRLLEVIVEERARNNPETYLIDATSTTS